MGVEDVVGLGGGQACQSGRSGVGVAAAKAQGSRQPRRRTMRRR